MIKLIKMWYHKMWFHHHTEEYAMFKTLQGQFVLRNYAFVMARALRKRDAHFDAWYKLYNQITKPTK